MPIPPLHPAPVAERALDLIVMAASRGGIHAHREVLSALPPDLPAAVVVVVHRSRLTRIEDPLPEILRSSAALPVAPVQDGAPLQGGIVYVAPAHLHVTVKPDRTFALSNGTRIHYLLSAADPLFTSAAAVYGARLIAVVLTGGGEDGAEGVRAVHAAGGRVLAQDEATSKAWNMPRAAIATGCVDLVLPLREIGPTLAALVTHGGRGACRGCLCNSG